MLLQSSSATGSGFYIVPSHADPSPLNLRIAGSKDYKELRSIFATESGPPGVGHGPLDMALAVRSVVNWRFGVDAVAMLRTADVKLMREILQMPGGDQCCPVHNNFRLRTSEIGGPRQHANVWLAVTASREAMSSTLCYKDVSASLVWVLLPMSRLTSPGADSTWNSRTWPEAKAACAQRSRRPLIQEYTLNSVVN